MSHPDWNACYATGDLPWDTGVPDLHLVGLVERGTLPRGRLLEIGCGTGTNAVWLAGEGFDVVGIDVSPLAIERAGRRRSEHGVPSDRCSFEVRDFLQAGGDLGPFDAVFDRGVFHVFDESADRAAFAGQVARALAPGGVWASVIGSTEGPARDGGPPRRTMRDIADAVEPVLECVSLTSVRLDAQRPAHVRAWVLVARRRSVPAQLSTKRD